MMTLIQHPIQRRSVELLIPWTVSHPPLLQHTQLLQQPLDVMSFGLLVASLSELTTTFQPWQLFSSPCPITAKSKPLVQRGSGDGEAGGRAGRPPLQD